MPDRRDRTDSLLDEIDNLVDESLERGDQSGSWRGERYDKCTLCGDDYHFLAITTKLVQMRNGSYGVDEFGQGVVDPSYVYQDDESPIVCPGSNYLGPPIGNREWAWYLLRKRGRRPSPRRHPANAPSNRETRTGLRPFNPGRPPRAHTWRFSGPFDPWVIDLQTEVEYVARSPMDPVPRAVGSHTYATFYYQDPYPVPSVQWLRENRDAIIRQTYIESGTLLHRVRTPAAVMKPIKFEYTSIHMHPREEGGMYPAYVEFTTEYPLWAHQWWLDLGWELINPHNRQVIPFDQRELPSGTVIQVPPGEYFEYVNPTVQVRPGVNLSTDGSFQVFEDEEIPITVTQEGFVVEPSWQFAGTIEEGEQIVPIIRGPEGPPPEAPHLEG